MITVKVKQHTDGSKTVVQVGEFKLSGVYQLIGGYYSGRMFQVNYISPHKQIIIEGDRQRMVSGVLVGDGVQVNSAICYLQ